MDRKIISNFLYNTIYQVITLLLPFITIPYISRIFSPEDIGIYSLTYSIIQMFLIIGMFAVGSYGVKEIAASRDNKAKLNEKFYEIRYMQKFTMFISLILYLLFVFFINSEYKIMYIIQSLYLVAGLIDISWLFMGLEDFKKTITRNIIVKLASLSLIFILIRSPKDLYIYSLILALSTLLGNASMWIYKGKLVNKIIIKKRNLKNNLVIAFSLLIPQIAFQIYTSFDRTILGVVSTVNEVGMYEQSQKMVRMAVSIVTSLGIVMLPRITNMISNNNAKEEINELLRKSLNLTLFISLGCTFGLVSINKNFVPWFFGNEYLEVALLLDITSIVCVLTALGGFLSNQYAIPKGNKRAYMIPLVSAAITSIILTSILGERFGAIGAGISIVITESIALLLRLIYLKNELNYKYLFSDLYKFILSGIFMFISISFLRYSLELRPSILSTIVEVLSGGSVYCICVLIFNKEYLYYIRNSKILSLLNKLSISKTVLNLKK